MQNEDLSDDLEPEERIQAIKALFRKVSNRLVEQLDKLEGTVSPADAAALKSKITELESAHVALVKAEEAFHEKSKAEAAESGIDFAVVRDQIGRALDRIRDADRSGDVFEHPDG